MNQLLVVVFDALTYSAWLFIIAVGLTLIYGVMKILNIAHGSLYALGAFSAVSLSTWWLAHGYPPMGTYAMLALAALLVGLIAGPLIERGLLQFLYEKDEVVLVLVTYALFLILEDLMKLVWGVDPLLLYEPYQLLGSIEIGGIGYQSFDLVLIAVAVLVASLNRTRSGKLLKAVIHDREMSAALGINVKFTYFLTFTAGAILAAVGGALTAPKISVVTGIGAEVIVLAFAVVVIGGLGSMGGAALGAIIVGLVRTIAVHYLPEVEVFSIYFVMAVVLIVRPKGLFSGAEVRRI